MFHAAHRAVRAAIGVSAMAVAIASAPSIQAQNPASTGASARQAPAGQSPNYELAAAWTAQKVSRLVFDTSVTPRWLETSDRFWYGYNTREGRRFMLVDPVRKTKGPLFDHAKMAAALTMITRIPYAAPHLPFTQVRFVRNDAAFEFEVQVPRDAVIPTTKPKAITTDAQDGLDEQSDEHDMEGPLLQQGQRGGAASAGPAAAPPAAAQPHARGPCTSSTTWPRRRCR